MSFFGIDLGVMDRAEMPFGLGALQSSMGVFTEAEIEYLRSQRLGRLATIGPDGQPHIAPVTFFYNADEDTIDIGGLRYGATKKWRDGRRNPKVTLLVDDVQTDPWRPRGVEIRGEAESHETGGDRMNPRFPNFAPEFIRIRPTRIVRWGLESEGADDLRSGPNARSVG